MKFKGLTIGIPKEIMKGERRVAAIPDTVKKMVSEGADVLTYKPPNPVGENAPVGVEYELGVIGYDRETKCGV